jgi:hypothetical protein
MCQLIEMAHESVRSYLMTVSSKKFRKFIIFTPGYFPDSGGAVVLHRLCHLLNENGYEASLYPAYKTTVIHQENWLKPLLSILSAALKSHYWRPFKTKTGLNTPVFKGKRQDLDDDHVVIYSEGVCGNPLNAKYVVRWLLHQPGYNYGLTCFGNSELMFAYNVAYSQNFELPFSRKANTRLYIPYENLSYYNELGAIPFEQRSGVAYCLRKGRDKPRVHDESEAILIDGLSHPEIAEIFKRVKTFISYDTKTAYSVFAAMCGADSIVIPDPGVGIESWEPQEAYRYGLSYGLENLEWARSTRPLMIAAINDDVEKTVERIHSFVGEVNEYFPCPPFR